MVALGQAFNLAKIKECEIVLLSVIEEQNMMQSLFLDDNSHELQKKVTNILTKKRTSISKILNTQGFSIRDLKRTYILDDKVKKNINKKNHWYWEINNS